MRKPFFRPLYLEPLEDRALTNMPFGQLGAPVVGFSSIGNPDLHGSSLVALNAITNGAGDELANNALFAQDSGSHGSSTAIGGTEQPCCLQVDPRMASGIASQETISGSGNFRNLEDFGTLSADFDSFADNSFSSAFPSAKGATPVLAGGGDGGMSLHAGVSYNAPSSGISSTSGSSSGIGGLSGGFIAGAPGSLASATATQSGPMILLPSGHNASTVVSGSQKVSPGSPSVSPAFASGPLHPQ